MRRAVLTAALAAASSTTFGAYQSASLESMASPAELVLKTTDGRTMTVRLPGVTTAPACAAQKVAVAASGLLPNGTPVRLYMGTGRPRIYFDLGGETVEWTQVALGTGLGNFTGADADLRDAEAGARAAKLGLWAGCSQDDVFSRVAREKNVTRPLLYAVALAESGRDGRPWPWTLNVSGRSHYYDSREKAHEALVGFIKRGHRSIDVGYMQVNLAYNGRRFVDTWQALDPYQNVLAAAEILRENYDEAGDIRHAVGRYHSRTPWRSTQYYHRVARIYATQIPKERN